MTGFRANILIVHGYVTVSSYIKNERQFGRVTSVHETLRKLCYVHDGEEG